MYKIVRSSRLYEQIVQQVEESIHKGAMKPGDQLPPERELAQQFGVSRTAVREAVGDEVILMADANEKCDFRGLIA